MGASGVDARNSNNNGGGKNTMYRVQTPTSDEIPKYIRLFRHLPLKTVGEVAIRHSRRETTKDIQA